LKVRYREYFSLELKIAIVGNGANKYAFFVLSKKGLKKKRRKGHNSREYKYK
jgi:hypothetical protein